MSSIYERIEGMSSARQLIIQGSVWLGVVIVFAIRTPLAFGDEIYPHCPFVLDSIFESNGYPVSPVGAAGVLVAVGTGWLFSALLLWAYGRWPRAFIFIRVALSKNGFPVAWRAGLLMVLVGVALLVRLQLTC